LPQLGPKTSLLARLQQARYLHRHGRAAGNDVSITDKLVGGARERQKVDAMVGEEALIFVCKQQLKKPRIDILLRRRQPPASFAGGIGAQKATLSVDDRVRILKVLAKPRRTQRINPRGEGKRH